MVSGCGTNLRLVEKKKVYHSSLDVPFFSRVIWVLEVEIDAEDLMIVWKPIFQNSLRMSTCADGHSWPRSSLNSARARNVGDRYGPGSGSGRVCRLASCTESMRRAKSLEVFRLMKVAFSIGMIRSIISLIASWKYRSRMGCALLI